MRNISKNIARKLANGRVIKSEIGNQIPTLDISVYPNMNKIILYIEIGGPAIIIGTVRMSSVQQIKGTAAIVAVNTYNIIKSH